MPSIQSLRNRFAHRGTLRAVAFMTATTMTGACAPAMAGYAARAAAAEAEVRNAIAREQSLQAASIPANTVGVWPLAVSTSDTSYAALGYGVAALISDDLSRSHQLVLVERLRLDAVMREQEFGRSGRMNSATAPRVGLIVGASRMVLGSLNIFPSGAVQMGSQVANTTSGVINASLSETSQLTQIFDLEKSMVFRLFETMGVKLTAAEKRAIGRRPTTSLAALMAFSNGVRAEVNRDLPAATGYYNSAIRIDPAFSDARTRTSAMSNTPLDAPGVTSAIARATGISTDLVNRPTPVQIGTGSDAPVTRKQVITITIKVGTP